MTFDEAILKMPLPNVGSLKPFDTKRQRRKYADKKGIVYKYVNGLCEDFERIQLEAGTYLDNVLCGHRKRALGK